MKYTIVSVKRISPGQSTFTPLNISKKWSEAHNGKVDVVLPGGTRCDCVKDTHAIEFDFGSKWAEEIGQSAYYALQTGKKAGVVLVLETVKDRKYWIRLNSTIQHFKIPIDTWNIGNALY